MQSEELEPSSDTLEEDLFLGKSIMQTVQDIRTTKRAEGKEDITMEIRGGQPNGDRREHFNRRCRHDFNRRCRHDLNRRCRFERPTSTEDADMTSTEDADPNDINGVRMETREQLASDEEDEPETRQWRRRD
jgi:hypothetical protein